MVVAIEEGHLLNVLEHPNAEKYENQIILLVEIEGYAFCVPCVPGDKGNYFLKTAFPSRRYTKQYLWEEKITTNEEKELIRSVEKGEWTTVPHFEALKTKALEEGIPYQTLVTSILHKYVTGKIKEIPS
jgi:hypothetical protein